MSQYAFVLVAFVLVADRQTESFDILFRYCRYCQLIHDYTRHCKCTPPSHIPLTMNVHIIGIPRFSCLPLAYIFRPIGTHWRGQSVSSIMLWWDVTKCLHTTRLSREMLNNNCHWPLYGYTGVLPVCDHGTGNDGHWPLFQHWAVHQIILCLYRVYAHI